MEWHTWPTCTTMQKLWRALLTLNTLRAKYFGVSYILYLSYLPNVLAFPMSLTFYVFNFLTCPICQNHWLALRDLHALSTKNFGVLIKMFLFKQKVLVSFVYCFFGILTLNKCKLIFKSKLLHYRKTLNSCYSSLCS